MVTKIKQTDFTYKFDNAVWHIIKGDLKEDADMYYSGQMELLRLCEEYVDAWYGGSENGSKR